MPAAEGIGAVAVVTPAVAATGAAVVETPAAATGAEVAATAEVAAATGEPRRVIPGAGARSPALSSLPGVLP
jgi:hypothetical protein